MQYLLEKGDKCIGETTVCRASTATIFKLDDYEWSNLDDEAQRICIEVLGIVREYTTEDSIVAPQVRCNTGRLLSNKYLKEQVKKSKSKDVDISAQVVLIHALESCFSTSRPLHRAS